jgi:hypothetical protein
MKHYLDDIFYWLGAGLITTGAFFVTPVAALFTAGVFCLLFGFLIGRAQANSAPGQDEESR